jgi:hypothetical protein
MDKALLIDVRGVKGEQKASEWNAGLAYRWLNANQDKLFGVYGFYDQKKSNLENSFKQLTVGGEFKTDNWTARGNFYAPIGTTAYAEASGNKGELRAAPEFGYQNLYISYGYERSVGGADAEVGRVIPHVKGLTGYVGGYYFNNQELEEAITGPRVRAEYDLGALNLSARWTKHLLLEAAWQNDKVKGTVFNIGMRLNIPLGNAVATNGVSSRMMEHIRRDVNVVTTLDNDKYVAYTNSQGEVLNFATVNSEDEINTALVANATRPDVVIIGQDFAAGNTIALGNDLIVTGGNFEYTPGYSFDLGPATTPTITTTDKDLLSVGKNVRIQDVNLTIISEDNTDTYQYFNAIKNAEETVNNVAVGQSVGTLQVQNVTFTNGVVNVSVEDGSTDSSVTISNNTFNLPSLNNTSGSGTPTYAISIQSAGGAGGTAVQAAVNTNTINFLVNADDAMKFDGGAIYLGVAEAEETVPNAPKNQMTITGVSANKIEMDNDTIDLASDFDINVIEFENYGTQTISGDVAGNTVNSGNVTGSTVGNLRVLFFNNHSTGTQTMEGDITGNTFNSGDVAFNGGYSGLVLDNSQGTQVMNGNISYNTITIGNMSNSTAYGILLSNSGTQKVTGDISSNNLSAGAITDASYYGIALQNSLTGTQTLESNIQDNTVDTGALVGGNTVSYVSGIQAYNTGAQQSLKGNISGNIIQIGNISAVNSAYPHQVYGIWFSTKNQQSLTGDISGNTINIGNISNVTSNAESVYGLHFEVDPNGTQSLGGDISGNTINIGNLSSTSNGTFRTAGLAFFSNNGSLAQNLTGNISGNNITIGNVTMSTTQSNASTVIAGIWVGVGNSGEAQTIDGDMSENTIQMGTLSGIIPMAAGIYVSNKSENAQKITGNLSGNEISGEDTSALNTQGSVASGVYFLNTNTGSQSVDTGFYDNTVTIPGSTTISPFYTFSNATGGSITIKIGNGSATGGQAAFAEENSNVATTNVIVTGTGASYILFNE